MYTYNNCIRVLVLQETANIFLLNIILLYTLYSLFLKVFFSGI